MYICSSCFSKFILTENRQSFFEIACEIPGSSNERNVNHSFSHYVEADKLCGRLYQKLNQALGQKVVMDHMPLLMVCLEVILKYL